ncbi:MAG TPA: serine/threonine-protein kinase [Pyrinomonadaceae bacterium]|jgi:serine/threonine protein kinase|nr:serine/threonine-protein kinase [Pyrinomonadaceae bacterium]
MLAPPRQRRRLLGGAQEFQMLEPNTLLQKKRYRVIKQLGRGGMGAVYEAIDQRMKCTVVLKRTLSESEDLMHAFEREASLLANLRHPALPKVMDHFVERGGQYLVMEHIPGQDLAEILRMLGRPFAPNEVLRWADELLRVLEYLHGMNPPILHRDIKPSNLKLTGSGEVFLLDFGLAKGAAGQMSTIGQGARSIAGYTPIYASLEQILRSDSQMPGRQWVEILSPIDSARVALILDSPTDERADLYSLGATLHQLLTNEMPTHAGNRAMYVWKGQPDPVRPISELNPLVPTEVADVIGSAMALNPERRPPSASAMRAAMRDAGQALRSHTGQVSFQRMPEELREAIAEDAAKRVRRMLDSAFVDLGHFLNSAQSDLDRLSAEVESLKKIPAETEALHENLRRLESEMRDLRTALDKAKETGTVVRGMTEQTAERAAREVAWEVVPQLAAVLIKQRLDETATSAEVVAAPAVVEVAPAEVKEEEESLPAAQPVAVGRYGTMNMNFPVEVAEEHKRFHNEARRWARLLVSEIKLYNEQKVKDGFKNSDLYDRLREDIDKSRLMYDKRVRPEVSSRYDYFHHELVNMLADGDPSKLGIYYSRPKFTK